MRSNLLGRATWLRYLPLSAVGFASLFGCAASATGVTRMADGVRYDGRYVPPEAYAAYLRGVEREANGDYGAALEAYAAAVAEDTDSAEIWARIGAVRCVLGNDGAAREAFERGVAADPEYFGNFLERARCAERAHAPQRALEDAGKAVARRPDDEAANLLVARSLSALGRREEARAWLEAFYAYRASSGYATLAVAAARPKAQSERAPGAASVNGPRSAAFRDLSSGRAETARKRAEIELAADPSNSDAWVASLVACDALRDSQCFESALVSLRTPSSPPSRTALGYLNDLLVRRTGANLTF